MRLTRCVLVAVPLVVAPLAACGDDSSSGGSYQVVPAAAVTAGLGKLQTEAARVAAAPKGEVDKAYEAVESTWQSFEGTIKKNDKDAYLAFEDTLAGLKKAAKADDQAAEAKALADLAAAATSYLASFPG